MPHQMPTKQGQICKIINQPSEEFIVIDDPGIVNDTGSINVVSLKDLQRNIENPLAAPKVSSKKRVNCNQ